MKMNDNCGYIINTGRLLCAFGCVRFTYYGGTRKITGHKGFWLWKEPVYETEYKQKPIYQIRIKFNDGVYYELEYNSKKERDADLRSLAKARHYSPVVEK